MLVLVILAIVVVLVAMAVIKTLFWLALIGLIFAACCAALGVFRLGHRSGRRPRSRF